MSVLKVYLSQQWATVGLEELQGKGDTNKGAPSSQVSSISSDVLL